MRCQDESLRDELLAMVEEDHTVREELAAEGSLFEGYQPRMEAVHKRNAARLVAIIDEHGWPGRTLVGEDGAEAAWQLLQHSIGSPMLQRRGLTLIKEAAAQGEARLWQVALLEDRIRTFEGKPQVYGTQYDWDENGEMSLLAIEDPERVDERRKAVGLLPLDENTRLMREGIARSKEQPPVDLGARRKEMEEWSRSVGWLD